MAGKPPPERQCTAESKRRPDERCGAWAMKGKTVCYHHGAKSLQGPESGTWVDGSSSKFGAIFSGDALEHYEFARRDEGYLELREDIAALDTLIVQELRAAKAGEGGALWEELRSQWSRFQEAQPSKDATTAGRALRRMGEIIGEGAGRHAAQDQALEIFERKRRFTETERKRRADEERMIAEARVLAFVAALVAIVNEETPERDRRARIASKVARLVHTDIAAGGGGSLTAV